MAKFKVGSKVDFYRNPVLKLKNIPVCDVLQEIKGVPQMYCIESAEFGFIPDKNRIKLHKLDSKKNYLFVLESELSEPGKVNATQVQQNAILEKIMETTKKKTTKNK